MLFWEPSHCISELKDLDVSFRSQMLFIANHQNNGSPQGIDLSFFSLEWKCIYKRNNDFRQIPYPCDFEFHMGRPIISFIIEGIDISATKSCLDSFKNFLVINPQLYFKLRSNFLSAPECFVLWGTDTKASFSINESNDVMRVQLYKFGPSLRLLIGRYYGLCWLLERLRLIIANRSRLFYRHEWIIPVGNHQSRSPWVTFRTILLHLGPHILI